MKIDRDKQFSHMIIGPRPASAMRLAFNMDFRQCGPNVQPEAWFFEFARAVGDGSVYAGEERIFAAAAKLSDMPAGSYDPAEALKAVISDIGQTDPTYWTKTEFDSLWESVQKITKIYFAAHDMRRRR
jgi:hypothetical protein